MISNMTETEMTQVFLTRKSNSTRQLFLLEKSNFSSDPCVFEIHSPHYKLINTERWKENINQIFIQVLLNPRRTWRMSLFTCHTPTNRIPVPQGNGLYKSIKKQKSFLTVVAFTGKRFFNSIVFFQLNMISFELL